MAQVKLTDAEQAVVVSNLDRLYNISACRATANSVAAIYKAVYPRRKFGDAPWAAWVEPAQVTELSKAPAAPAEEAEEDEGDE